MSTRANIHFVDASPSGEETLSANIYRHYDGYPSGLGADLHKFLDDVSKLEDKRFCDAEYLAAKFLIWQARIYAGMGSEGDGKNFLNFLSVAPCIEDHGDIAYRYKVVCRSRNKRPSVFVEQHGGGWTEIADADAAKAME